MGQARARPPKTKNSRPKTRKKWPGKSPVDDGNYNLPLTLRGTGNTFGWFDDAKVMAGSPLTPIPPPIVFFIFRRNLVKGIALTGHQGLTAQ